MISHLPIDAQHAFRSGDTERYLALLDRYGIRLQDDLPYQPRVLLVPLKAKWEEQARFWGSFLMGIGPLGVWDSWGGLLSNAPIVPAGTVIVAESGDLLTVSGRREIRPGDAVYIAGSDRGVPGQGRTALSVGTVQRSGEMQVTSISFVPEGRGTGYISNYMDASPYSMIPHLLRDYPFLQQDKIDRVGMPEDKSVLGFSSELEWRQFCFNLPSYVMNWLSNAGQASYAVGGPYLGPGYVARDVEARVWMFVEQSFRLTIQGTTVHPTIRGTPLGTVPCGSNHPVKQVTQHVWSLLKENGHITAEFGDLRYESWRI